MCWRRGVKYDISAKDRMKPCVSAPNDDIFYTSAAPWWRNQVEGGGERSNGLGFVRTPALISEFSSDFIPSHTLQSFSTTDLASWCLPCCSCRASPSKQPNVEFTERTTILRRSFSTSLFGRWIRHGLHWHYQTGNSYPAFGKYEWIQLWSIGYVSISKKGDEKSALPPKRLFVWVSTPNPFRLSKERKTIELGASEKDWFVCCGKMLGGVEKCYSGVQWHFGHLRGIIVWSYDLH